MGLRLTEYWRSCGLCLVKIAQLFLLFGLKTQLLGGIFCRVALTLTKSQCIRVSQRMNSATYDDELAF
jgi:hypothetical protein